MANADSQTLRLLFPQWQGGNNPPYAFGTKLLDWLAPQADGPVEEVNVQKYDGTPLKNEDGIMGRAALLDQVKDARRLIDKHEPSRLVVLGGDCGVDLAPFAYLNERYDGDLAVLWLDAHPDIMTPQVFENAHAMVMGHLLGEGDPDFVKAVPQPIKPENVMFAGVQSTGDSAPEIDGLEEEMFKRLNLRRAGPHDLADTSEPVLEWLKSINAKHLAIHFDLDVLDPTLFRSLLFANPESPARGEHPSGKMTMTQVVRLLTDVSKTVDVVGLGITEHLPWDSMALHNMLSELPLIGSPSR